MKFLRAICAIVLLVGSMVTTANASATLGTIDPRNVGNWKALLENTTLTPAPTVNFGRFTSQTTSNITISNTELRGYAWGEAIGWIITNCADTVSGCSTANSNFKIANDGNGNLSGYAWGENTGWINFGPFTNPAISTVKITNGLFGGTLGAAGYAWVQNYGWMKFDCSSPSSCVETDWGVTAVSCSDGIQNQGETGVDTGGPCPGGGTTGGPAQCRDGRDNDGDALIDIQDPGCHYDYNAANVSSYVPSDNDERDFCEVFQADPACRGIDIDPPSDPGGGGSGGSSSSGGSDPAGTSSAQIQQIVRAPFVNPPVAATTLPIKPDLVGIAVIAPQVWMLFGIFLGWKKNKKPWGTVYNSITKQPIDPAYVVLMDMNGQEVATSVTDRDGRYGFSVPAGTYRILVNKTNFTFPSQKLVGKTHDEMYENLYFGETIVTTEEGEVIAKDIPLDQHNFDWNEYNKQKTYNFTFFHRRDFWINAIGNFLFVVGFVYSVYACIVTYSLYNAIVVGLYIVLSIVKLCTFKIRPKGRVVDRITGRPVACAIVRVFSLVTDKELVHKLTDGNGRYYCILINGTYRVSIDRKNIDGSYTSNPILGTVVVTKGYLKKHFSI